MKIVIVSFNVKTENSVGYYKTTAINQAADYFIRQCNNDLVDFMSIRIIKDPKQTKLFQEKVQE